MKEVFVHTIAQMVIYMKIKYVRLKKTDLCVFACLILSRINDNTHASYLQIFSRQYYLFSSNRVTGHASRPCESCVLVVRSMTVQQYVLHNKADPVTQT